MYSYPQRGNERLILYECSNINRDTMRACNTCECIHVDEIDSMIMAGWRFKEIYRYLQGKYPDDKKLPSYESIRYHARTHVEGMVKKAATSSRARQKAIQKEIKASITSAEQLRRNLHYISQALIEFWDNRDPEDTKDLKDLSRLISTANKTVELLLKFQSQIQEKGETSEDVYERLMFCLHDFPSDKIDLVIARWEDYDKQ